MAAVAPTIEDARRAAEALAAAGVGRVVLFGSVARGEATARSDIDLVAIYDDIVTYTAHQFADEPGGRRVDYCASQVTRFLDTRSLETGRPLQPRAASDPPGVSL